MKCVCKKLILKAGERMYKKITSIQKTISKGKGKGKDKRTTTTKKEEGKSSCTHCQKDGHDDEHCWKLHPELRPKKFGGKRKQKIVATVQQDLGSDSGDEEKITTVGLQGKVSFMLVQVLQFHLLKMIKEEVNYST
jgi:hypothetical protein